jgi:two-component system cell cycle sensor histidine kinase/response regulator CckA
MPSAAMKKAKVRILVVEDEGLIAEEIQDRLQRLGYEVTAIADSGEKAIAAAEQTQPDLVLMDIRIKGKIDGIDTAKEIRKRQSVPIIYLTAHSDVATLERAKQTAPGGYVLKPFHESDLVVAIEMATHKHLLERQLKESEQRFATTLASIGDGVVATDRRGQVTFMNRVAEALTDWRLADARGLAIEEIVPIVREADALLMEHPARIALRVGERVSLAESCALVTRRHETLPIDDSAAPILTESGELLGAVIVFRDIRQHRLHEDALRRAEEQLYQAQKMEAVGRLAGGVAHDFNNLLTVINGYSELLLDSNKLESSCKSVVEQVEKAGKRAAALTSQLLAFSRKQIFEPEVLNLNVLIADIEVLLKRIIGEDISFTTVLSPNLSMIRADASQLEQVIMNLAANARDAMPGGGQLTIETQNAQITEAAVEGRPEIAMGQFVMMSVTDTGCGMDKYTQQHVFEPFFTTKDLGKGTGLGLSTVYGIVKQSGGFIYVYSEVGRGTSLKIYLPVVEGTCDPAASSHSADPLLGTETILLVEDEDAVRELSCSALRRYGYHVIAASCGEEALSALEQSSVPVHLLVTDVVMPEMSGSELASRVVALNGQIRVLYLSGYTDDAMVRHGVLRGDVAFLQKPHTMAALARKVREVLDVGVVGDQ